MKYYRLDRIKEACPDASYYMIIGERSNGKTFASLEYGLKKYFEDGSQLAYIRRWDEDIRGKRGATIFDGLIYNKVIDKLSKGKWDGVYYYSGRWFLTKTAKDGGVIKDDKPFAYAFSLNSMEHDKSTSYPWIRTIIFDEFLSRGRGLGDDEFVLLMNVLSTIIRDPSRTDIEIFLLANTVNFDSIYFKEFGIENIRNMKQGTIDIYTYGENSTVKMAVEYCENAKDKQSRINDRYFAFNNPRLKMITEGAWEMDIYPHSPCKWKPKDVLFSYFIQYNDDLLQADIIQVEDNYFTFIHRKTTPIQDTEHDLIFSNFINPRPNYRMNLWKPEDTMGKDIKNFFTFNRVYYQDNVIGEIVNNYNNWCTTV